MAKALSVAYYLIDLASLEDEPEFLTALRLQKLLYYVQGWSLAQRKKPMFEENIQAWANGPVVARVYTAFSDQGGTPIDPKSIAGLPRDLSEEERGFIGSVWNAYKNYSAISLRDMTHRETPWIDARKGLSPVQRSTNIISHEAMRSYFSQTPKA